MNAADIELTLDLPAMTADLEDSAATLDRDLRPKNDWGDLPFTALDPYAELEPIEYVWGCFAPGKVSAIVAYAYTAKTPFALYLAICIARGIACFGRPTLQRKTVYFAFEGARNARRKAQRICRGLGFTLADIADQLEIVQAPPGFLNAAKAVALCERLKANGVGAVLCDTYGSALDGGVDRNSSAFSDALKILGDQSDLEGLLCVVLLHQRKDTKGLALQRIDGHNSVAGAIQGAVELTRPDPNDKTRILVSCVRAPDDEPEPFEIRWRDTDDGVGLVADVAAPGGQGRTAVAAADAAERNRLAILGAVLDIVRGREVVTRHDAVREPIIGVHSSRKDREQAFDQLAGAGILEKHEPVTKIVGAVPRKVVLYTEAPRTARVAEARLRLGLVVGG